MALHSVWITVLHYFLKIFVFFGHSDTGRRGKSLSTGRTFGIRSELYTGKFDYLHYCVVRRLYTVRECRPAILLASI